MEVQVSACDRGRRTRSQAIGLYQSCRTGEAPSWLESLHLDKEGRAVTSGCHVPAVMRLELFHSGHPHTTYHHTHAQDVPWLVHVHVRETRGFVRTRAFSLAEAKKEGARD